MKIYNTLSKKKEEFVPIEEGKVRMYVCGPTVYNYIHIGNARPMIVFDTVRRYLEFIGYDVNYVSNFTDVDDKIIKKAIEEGSTAEEVSKRYIAECKKDMADMNVMPATTHPLATEEIGGMIQMISTLIEKGYAYVVSDGTVYYRTRKFADYGKLSHKKLDDLEAGHSTAGDGHEQSGEHIAQGGAGGSQGILEAQESGHIHHGMCADDTHDSQNHHAVQQEGAQVVTGLQQDPHGSDGGHADVQTHNDHPHGVAQVDGVPVQADDHADHDADDADDRGNAQRRVAADRKSVV